MRRYFRLVVLVLGAWCSTPALARHCPAAALSTPKSSVLYLYYPAAPDLTFPNWQSLHFSTAPLPAFNLNDLDGSIGTEGALRLRVQQMAETALCEFDVAVRTVTARAPTEPRWQVIGLGSDISHVDPVKRGFAVAEHEDLGDGGAQDHARIWLGDFAAWLGPEIQGANATLERWATVIANVALHEVGHNHGTTHGDAIPRSGEDAIGNHFMAGIGTGATQQSITAGVNHHSDRSYEALAHSIGLSARTIANWDFVNPNPQSATQLHIRIYSPSDTLTLGWSYQGPLNPWGAADIALIGPVQFRGMPMYEHLLVFHIPKSQPWANGPAGIVPPGASFHVGAGFAQGDPFVVHDATLIGPSGELDLHPRMVDFAGHTGFVAPVRGGLPGFSLAFGNPGRSLLLLRDVDVRFSPRMIDIETMMPDVRPQGMDDRPAALYAREARPGAGIMTREQLRARVFRLGREPVVIPIAALTDPRHLMRDYARGHCRRNPPAREPAPASAVEAGPLNCLGGTALSLFPATYVYVSATVVDPAARYWDPRRRRMVRGPLQSRLFFQVAGTVPDANRNGIDDLLDIRTGRSPDRNRDGVPDDAGSFRGQR